MSGKLAHSFVLLTALGIVGLTAPAALAADVKDSGSIEAAYVKRDAAQIPDQQGHVLLLTQSSGTSINPGGLVDGFATTVYETADLQQGSGSHEGYVVYTKGPDQQVVKFEGRVATTMKDGKPFTTMDGDYVLIEGTGALSGIRGEGTYSGYFTAEDKFNVDWKGHRSPSKNAMMESK